MKGPGRVWCLNSYAQQLDVDMDHTEATPQDGTVICQNCIRQKADLLRPKPVSSREERTFVENISRKPRKHPFG